MDIERKKELVNYLNHCSILPVDIFMKNKNVSEEELKTLVKDGNINFINGRVWLTKIQEYHLKTV